MKSIGLWFMTAFIISAFSVIAGAQDGQSRSSRQRQQNPDSEDRDGDHVLQVAVGDAADVVDGWRLAADGRVGRPDRPGHPGGLGAQ